MSPKSDQSTVTVSPKRSAGFAGQPPEPTVIWMTGEHDISNASRLSQAIAATIALDDEDVVVDLGDVTFLSAATITVLLRANQFLNARSRSLVLRSPRRNAIRLLGLCGLGHVISPPPQDVVAQRVDAPSLRTLVEVPTEPRATKSDASAAAAHVSAFTEKGTPYSAV